MSNARLESRFNEKSVYLPPRNTDAAHAAILALDGGASHLTAQDDLVLVKNDIRAATAEALDFRRRARRCERRLRWLEWKRTLTPALSSEAVYRPRHRPTRLQLAGIATLLILFVVGMSVANDVTTAYVLASASDLFAGNPVGAHLFATLPMFAAVALKAFDRTLNAAARRRFGVAVLSLGFVGFSGWLVTAALTFAPQVGASSDWLLPDVHSNLRTMILVLSTNITEVSFGYGIFLWAERLLFGAPTIRWLANPKHELLSSIIIKLSEDAETLRASQYAAEGFLARVEAGRRLTRTIAEQEVERAREQWVQAQECARSYAIGCFLQPDYSNLSGRPQ